MTQFDLESELKKAETYFMQPTPNSPLIKVPVDFNGQVMVFDGETGVCFDYSSNDNDETTIGDK